MLIKDPSRFKIRNANSYDCVQLYRLLKECYLEVLNKVNDQRQGLKQIDLNRTSADSNGQTDGNNNQLTHSSVYPSIGLDSFEEFVDCLGFGKRGEERKVLDCLLIEDVSQQKIIALVTYSYAYFSYVGREIHMNHFFVRPEYRMNGFGSFLFRNLVKLCAEAKLNKLKYDAPRKLKGFCKFMKKMGARSFTDDTNYCLFKMDLKRIDAELNPTN